MRTRSKHTRFLNTQMRTKCYLETAKFAVHHGSSQATYTFRFLATKLLRVTCEMLRPQGPGTPGSKIKRSQATGGRHCAYMLLHLCEGGGFTSWHLEFTFSERTCALKMVRMARDNIRRSVYIYIYIYIYVCVWGALLLRGPPTYIVISAAGTGDL